MYNASYSWWNWKSSAGFRLSLRDGLAILLCMLTTWGTWPLLGEMAILLPIVLGHFFLFCNVFRIPRRPELFWSAAFVLNFGTWVVFDRFTWSGVLLTQSPITLGVILLSVLRSDYHGIGYSLVPWGRRPENAAEEGQP